MRSFSVILGFVFSLYCYGQGEPLEGYIEDQSNFLPLHGAHIQNHSSKKLVISAPNGTFTMPVAIGDSIAISYTGFETQSFVVTQDHIEKRQFFSFKPDEVTLQDIVVTPFPEYWRFKQLILEIDPPDSSLNIQVPSVGKYAFYDPRSTPLNQNLEAPMVRIPFDLERFTKRGKEKKKLAEILAQDRKWKLANEKFNRDWVASLTNLEADELTSFIAFCNFSADYIIETHLVDLKTQVLVLLEEFNSDSKESGKEHYSPGA